jgi:hypothetical protein
VINFRKNILKIRKKAELKRKKAEKLKNMLNEKSNAFSYFAQPFSNDIFETLI